MKIAKIIALVVGIGFIWSTLATAAPPQTRGQSPGKRPKALGTKRPKQIPREQPLQLDAVQASNLIDGQSVSLVSYSRTVSLYFHRQGPAPTHYRVSENATFSGASWQVFAQMQLIQYTFTQDTPGQKTLYAQLQKETNPQQTPQRTAVRSTQIEYRKPPVIQQLTVSGSPYSPPGTTHARDVTVNWTRAGNASRYYLSEQPNFSDVITPGSMGSGTSQSPPFQLSDGYGVKTLYLKLLDLPYPGSNPGIYAESEVSTVTINFQPIQPVISKFDINTVDNLLTYARDQGYQFEANLVKHSGNCEWDINTRADMIAQGSLDSITCDFFLFSGKKPLKSGWRITNLRVGPPSYKASYTQPNSHGWQILKPPSGQSANPSMSVRVFINDYDMPNNSETAWISGIDLQGPSNETWQHAFHP